MELYKGNGDKITIESSSSSSSEITIPEYWQDEVDDTISKIEANRLTIGKHIFEFVFLTDVHWKSNAKNSPKLIQYVLNKTHNYMPIVCGGDVISHAQSTKALGVAELTDFIRSFNQQVFSTIGNHDLNSEDNNAEANQLTESETYTLLNRESESIDDCVTYADVRGSYLDNKSQKVRIIQFAKHNRNTLSTEANQYLADRLNELEDGWTAVIVCHDMYSSGVLPTSVVNATTNMSAKIALVCCGHTHTDQSVTTNSYPIVVTMADSCGESATTSGKMALGTATEQCVDFVQIDLDNKKIYMTRLGGGADREFTYQ